MTSENLRLCKLIVKYKKQSIILKKSGLKEYSDIQDRLGSENIKVSDFAFSDDTIYTLKDNLVEEMEQMKRQRLTLRLSVYGAVTSTIAIILEVVLHAM